MMKVFNFIWGRSGKNTERKRWLHGSLKDSLPDAERVGGRASQAKETTYTKAQRNEKTGRLGGPAASVWLAGGG